MSSDTAAAELRRLIGGAVVGPGESGYDAARAAFNLTVEQRPALVAEPLTAEEVAAAVRFAVGAGLRVAPQRTGHNAGPLGSLEGTLLLKTGRLGAVEIDAAARRARVGAGARWEDVVPLASEHGLAALHGSSPDVGVVGYTLGGGLGWYARKHGLAANSVRAVELVDARGRLLRADRESEPELFWALRGGCGGLGVVTALEFDLLAVPEVYAGALFFPLERAAEVFHGWRQWTEGVPDEVTSLARAMRFPPFEEVPEPVRGKSFAIVEAAILGGEASAATLLEPLRALGPVTDSFATVPPAELAGLHMDPREPVAAASCSAGIGGLDAAGLDAFLAAAGPDSDSALVSAELRHCGGALARPAEGCGALGALAGEFLAFAVGIAADPQASAKTRADLDAVATALRPYRVCEYANFAETRCEPGSFFDPDTLARLRAVKRAWDPDGLFQANHPLDA